MTAKTCLAIYWQALRLLLKRADICSSSCRWQLSNRHPPKDRAMKSSSVLGQSHNTTRTNGWPGRARRGVLQATTPQARATGGRQGSNRHLRHRWRHLWEIHILDTRSVRTEIEASNGSIGAGEAFIHGYWSSPDLTAVVRVFVSNLDVLDALEGGLAKLGRPFVQACVSSIAIRARVRRKTSTAHYDLGNDLFEQFLDKPMMYSAAHF